MHGRSNEDLRQRKGESYNLKLQVMNGPHQNRLLFAFLKVTHKDENSDSGKKKMVQIANGMLSGLYAALSVDRFPSEDYPVGRPFRVKVAVEPHWQKPDTKENIVKRFMARHAGAQTQPPATAPVQYTAPAAPPVQYSPPATAPATAPAAPPVEGYAPPAYQPPPPPPQNSPLGNPDDEVPF